MSRRPVTVSTPGKLILMGEHAVVYGRPALIAALDLRLTARLAPHPDGSEAVHLDLPGLSHAETTSWDDLRAYAAAVRGHWEGYALQPGTERFRTVRGGDPAHVVKVALGEAAEWLLSEGGQGGIGANFIRPGDDADPPSQPRALPWAKESRPVGPKNADGVSRGAVGPKARAPLAQGNALGWEGQGGEGLRGLRLRVESELPIGSGFGSSAATATAVIAGCLVYHERAADPALVEKLALEVERRQHGLPSGVDGATVLYGGVLWARRLPEGGLERERLAVRSPLLSRLRVYDSGTPQEPTGAVVAAVRERRDRDPQGVDALLDRIEAATRAFRGELEQDREDPDRTLHLIRESEACLEGLGVVPEEARALIRRIESEGGAAKISGAGSLRGPGAGSLLVYHPDPERITGWVFLRPFPFYPVHLGAPGFREEAIG
jgi:mevalonate kinase